MMDPLPNCVSIWVTASSKARWRSFILVPSRFLVAPHYQTNVRLSTLQSLPGPPISSGKALPPVTRFCARRRPPAPHLAVLLRRLQGLAQRNLLNAGVACPARVEVALHDGEAVDLLGADSDLPGAAHGTHPIPPDAPGAGAGQGEVGDGGPVLRREAGTRQGGSQ